MKERVDEDFARFGEVEIVKQNPENEKEFLINFMDITNAMRAQAEVSKDTEYASMTCDFREDPCEGSVGPGQPEAPTAVTVKSLVEWGFVPKPPPSKPKPAPVFYEKEDSCRVIL